MTDETRELKDKTFRYGMLFGERVAFNTLFQFLEFADEHPEILKDAIKDISAVMKTLEEDYAIAKAEAKKFILEKYGEEEEDAEEQGQGEEV